MAGTADWKDVRINMSRTTATIRRQAGAQLWWRPDWDTDEASPGSGTFQRNDSRGARVHIPTHILSGWCVGNLLPLNGARAVVLHDRRRRRGRGRVGHRLRRAFYWDWHHKVGHNVFFAALLAGGLAAFSSRKWLAFVAYFILAHLHLVLDYFGSGPGWPIYYLWPVSNLEIVNPRAWPFFSWQNITAAYALVAWTVWIAWRSAGRRSKCLMPRLDRQLVALLQKRRRTADNA